MEIEIPEKEKIEKMSSRELSALASDLRSVLLTATGRKGGHLASNLGAVELTIALFSVFDFPKDKVIFDVGHQAYTYKLLTGRQKGFEHLRDLNGLSGFPKRRESEYDSFDTGHSSTSVSAGLGMARARDLMGEKYSVISVIGDGSMTGGLAYEALNNASRLTSNFIIVLNDNNMSISPNVGGIHKYLTGIRAAKSYNLAKQGVKKTLSLIPRIGEHIIRKISDAKDSLKELFVPTGMYFENMGITYLGPVDGHNVREMQRVFRKARELNRAVLIHVITTKGKGYQPAEEHPDAFHGVDPFDPLTGRPLQKKTCATWTDIFSNFMVEAGEEKKNLAAITAAMGNNVGLGEFEHKFPGRFFDVGIAEEHAVTFAAGLATGGMHPVVAIFSSFLQRAYDQIVEDVCLQDLPVTFCIDRAGIVGRDGETHQGQFDIAFMRSVPNLEILSPKDSQEFMSMLRYAVNRDHPTAVRYPRGAAVSPFSGATEPVVSGKAEIMQRGGKAAILAFGDMVSAGVEAAGLLREDGIEVTLVNLRFAKPLDEELIRSLLPGHELLVTLENGVISGGVGEAVASFVASVSDEKALPRVITLGIPDRFVPQGDVCELMELLHLDPGSVAERIRKELRHE